MRRAHSRKHGLTFLKAPPATVLLVPQIIGYGRVSTEDQVMGVQIKALEDAGCDIIFSETISSKNAKRPEFNAMLKHVERGDTIIFYSFSRLWRDVKNLLGFIDDMKAFGITLRSTTEPHIDPYTTNGRMMVSLIGTMDEHERNRVIDRTKDAMQHRIREGMYIGAPRKVTAPIAKKMKALRNLRIPVPTIATRFGVSTSAVYANT